MIIEKTDDEIPDIYKKTIRSQNKMLNKKNIYRSSNCLVFIIT